MEYEQLSFDWFNTYEEVAKSIKPVGEFRTKKCGNCELENLQWITKTANFRKPRKYKTE